MEYLMSNPWIVWIIVGVFFLIVELCTTALVSIWFVPAAIITCLLSFVIDSALWQIAIFVFLSAIFMVISRKIYKKYIKKPVDEVDQNEKLLGKITQVLDYPGNKVYVVKGEHEYMIPAVKAFILSTDMDNGTMQVKTIEGMRTDES